MSTYTSLLLQEDPPRQQTPHDESFLQRLWFEQATKPELTTDTGEKIRIVQPGFWNHSEGPDFLNASIINEKGNLESGDIEIHHSPQAWEQHQHHTDSRYSQVILHLVWKPSSKTFFTRTHENRYIRQVFFHDQLQIAEKDCYQAFTSSTTERTVGTHLGKCHPILTSLSPPEILAFLKSAGWHRFHQKVALWKIRRRLLGQEQCLWIGLAEALGYRKNQIPFTSISRSLPIKTLQKFPFHKREALLLGLSGFLPDRRLTGDSAPWLRTIWDQWWLLKSDYHHLIIPKHLWNLSAIRPVNRPERRLALLSIISAPENWQTFLRLSSHINLKELTEFINHLHHSFWNNHYTISSKPSPHPMPLIGKDRLTSLAYNVLYPLHWDSASEQIRSSLEPAKTSHSNRYAKIAATRLFGDRILEPEWKPIHSHLLAQEGLLQIYKDFCSHDTHACEKCTFPATLKSQIKTDSKHSPT